MKAATSILSSASSIGSASLLKQDMLDRSVSSSRYLMLIMQVVDFLYLCPPMKCAVNYVLNSLKVLTELGISWLNQILAAPFSVVGKALHMISSTTP